MPATESLGQVSVLATQAATTAWGAVGDFFILIILTAALFLFAYYVGRGPFVAVLLSLYGAYAIYAAFPFTSYLPSEPPLTSVVAHAALYVGLGVAFYVILRRVVVSDFLYVGITGLIILSLLGATFIVAVANHVLLVTEIYQFTAPLEMLFAPTQYFFWWFIGPAVGLFFLAR
jgi:hypothetical protein